jgi:hexosaminidase
MTRWHSRTITLLASALLVTQAAAQDTTHAAFGMRVIPAPSSVSMGTGAPFALKATTTIVTDRGSAEAKQIGEMLASYLRPSTDFPVVVSAPAAAAAASIAPVGSIRLRLAADREALGDEGYELAVTADSVVLVARKPAGLFHGIQTIRQLFPPAIESDIGLEREWTIPALTITDTPRFSWRGSMLDVGRHFLTVQEVKQFIDVLALYKINILHLHLTDDQGWRIQIDSRPKLTTVGSLSQVGGRPAGFFTKRDYRDIVSYAKARYITIVPEIEMPGHSNAALTSYPALSCSVRETKLYTGTDVGWSTFCPLKASTYAFIDDVVREVAAMTPGPYFHIGGDEVASLPDSLFIRFIERAQRIVNKHGKRMIGWEEIAKAKLLPTTIAQQWKSDSVTAALQYGSKLIMSPSNRAYMDMKYTPSTELGLSWAAIIEVRDSYDWDPATYMPGVTEANVLGVEAPIWGETVRNITAVQYLTLPRLPALAEVGWTAQSGRNWENFRSRLAAHAPRWRYLGMNYYPSPQVSWW